MEFLSLFLTMLRLMLMVAIGFCMFKWKALPESSQTVLTKLVINLATPCSIIYSVISNDNLPGVGTMFKLLGLSFSIYIALTLIAVPLIRLLHVKEGYRGVYVTMSLFSNVLFIGLPVVQSVFGNAGTFYLAIFSIPFNPSLFTIGVYLLSKDGQVLHPENSVTAKLNLKSFISPTLVASAIAITLSVIRIPVPDMLSLTMSAFAALTTPGALLVIGIALAKMPIRAMLGTPKIYAMSMLRLVVFPVLVWFVLHSFLQDTLAMGVIVICTAMPVAVSVPMLAAEYGSDENTAVQGVCVSTILSMVTIPALITLLPL